MSSYTAHTFRSLGLLSASSVLALLVSTGPTFAQDPAGGSAASNVRYSRESKKTQAKSGLLDTKFKKAAEDEKKRQTRKIDMMAGADFAKKRAAVEQEMADKQIEFLKRLIKTTDKSDTEYPDLLFRLSDHYLEKKAYFDLQSGKLYEAIYEAEDNGNKAGQKQLEDKQKRFQGQAREASEKATRVYEALVNDTAFGQYKRMDEALYYYAFELGALGQEQKMQAAYQQLINNYPDSEFISQAYLAFADYYYTKGQIQNAVRLYEKVTEFKDSPVYAFALYKLAWCHLNPIGTAEPRYDKSLDYFIKTVEATVEGRAGSEANGKQLRRDARRDMVRAYVHASKPSKAWEFFNKWGVGPQKDENDARKMMELLANQYFGEGKYVESTFVYKKLQEEFSTDFTTCEWQGRVVVNTLATDNKEIQWQETKRLGEFWTQYKDGDFKKVIKKKCRDDALDTMKQMATVWHDEAAKTKIDRTYELAEMAYGEFLKVFPGDQDAYELQYYFAELLWELAEKNYKLKEKGGREKGLEYFLKARGEFVKTLELKPTGKYTTDAAYAQMLAMKNYLEYDETGGKKRSCQTNSEGVCVYREKKEKKVKKDKDSSIDALAAYPESEYTDDEKQMLGAYDIYTQYVKNKDDKELPKIIYHRAKLMMMHNKFKEAKPLLEEMVTKFDGTLYAAWCSEMLLDLLTISWVDKNNTPQMTVDASNELEKWSLQLQKMKVWNHPEADEIRTAVPTLIAGIGWKKGMAYRDSGAAFVAGSPGGDNDGFRKCADQFITVYNENETHDRADTLLWNAAECSDAAYMVGQAIQIRNILLERHPDSKHAKDSLHFIAESYQAVAYYADSAKRFEEFAVKYEGDKRSPNALQNAYLFRLGLGDEIKAQENLVKYEGIYKKKNPETAAKIFWSKHGLLKTDDERRKHAEEYLKTYGARGGIDRQAVAEGVIAQMIWRSSCTEDLLYDSCISIKRKKVISGVEEIEKRKKAEARKKKIEDKEKDAKGSKKKYDPPSHCGSATQGIVTVHERDLKRSAAAQKRFATVLKLASKKIDIPADDLQRVEAFKNAFGMAMVYTADLKYEEYLTVDMPGNLSFGVEDWKKGSGISKWEKEYAEQVKLKEDSEKRFTAFFDKKMKLGKELQDQYGAVKSSGSPYWVLAAAARTGTVQQNFADQLYRAEVPRDFKTEDQFYAYCDALADKADPVQTAALEAFTYCVERSTEFQFFNDFSSLCEDEMQQRDADKYPATNERFGRSIYTASRTSHVDVIKDPTGARKTAVKQKTKTAEGKAGEPATTKAEEPKSEDEAGTE